MAQFMGIDVGGGSPNETTDAIVALNRTLEYQFDNLDSQNIREIGGWRIGPKTLSSKNLDVGLSTDTSQLDNVRFWAGSTDMNTAPYRVYHSGHVVMNDVQMLGGNIIWGNVPPPSYSQILGSKPPVDANNTYSELLFNSGIRGFVSQVDPVDGITKLFLTADYIRAGTIRGVTINVDTDLTVGNNIHVGQINDPVMKQIIFTGQANISAQDINMSLSASQLDFLCSLVSFSQTGTVDFGNATITGVNFTAKFG